jgi:hypothetical protein
MVRTVARRVGLGSGFEHPRLEHAEPDQPAEHAGERDRGRLLQRRRPGDDLVEDEQDGRAVAGVEGDGPGVLDVHPPPVCDGAVEGEAPVDLGAHRRAQQQRDEVGRDGLEDQPHQQVEAGVDGGAEPADDGEADQLGQQRETRPEGGDPAAQERHRAGGDLREGVRRVRHPDRPARRHPSTSSARSRDRYLCRIPGWVRALSQLWKRCEEGTFIPLGMIRDEVVISPTRHRAEVRALTV